MARPRGADAGGLKMADEPQETAPRCPVGILRLWEVAYLELRAHDGGKALIRADRVVNVAGNHFGKAVVWTIDGPSCCATIHEYDEVIAALREASKAP